MNLESMETIGKVFVVLLGTELLALFAALITQVWINVLEFCL